MERLRVDEIGEVIRQGENECVEFKYGTLVLDAIAKCISAFANAKGGRIIIGYSARRKQIIGSSSGDQKRIERALQQLENPPFVDCYELYYEKKHLLIVDVEANQQDFTYYKGAIYIRTNDQNQLMDSADIKATYGKFFNQELSPYDIIERLNRHNANLQDQISKMEEKIDQYHAWDIGADKTSFKWGIFFCVAGSILGAIIGTVLGKVI